MTARCWGGNYSFEKGEEIRVRKGHPFAGRQGVLQAAYGKRQFGVVLTHSWLRPEREICVFEDALELLPIATRRRSIEAAVAAAGQ